jgi:glycosyltransferase involved in cell wall biosynthesis
MQKKLLFILNDAHYFISHRLDIALEAQKKDYKVHIATHDIENHQLIKKYGFEFSPIKLSRSGVNIFKELSSFYELYKLLKKIKPDVLHLVTIKPVIYGSIIARIIKLPKVVAAIPGLGHIFTAEKTPNTLLKFLVTCLYKIALYQSNTHVIFQNNDDHNEFLNLNIINSYQAHIINGSGVNLTEYKFTKENASSSKIIVMACRILQHKGILEFIEACEILTKKNIKAKFILAGKFDLQNPSFIKEETLKNLIKNTTISFIGFQENTYKLFKSAHVVVLPSYREGLPKVLSEAAACGRAIITTNVPGCKDAIIPGVTGLLVPPKNAHALAEAIEFLIKNDALRISMGNKARQFAEKQFNIDNIVKQHLDIYEDN